ncbi:uncharacterized protein EI97DRAFT_436534 [Westerdykella ornata]|uniref:Uncharacterized protein n=1 Tax=Westerdykella ornata TaxID=318751 RepID=A0A6A6JCL5_WESOR|nr:uncharacterized protein EI97DRAFT_436534 [Westerdykella ornata]KAF2272929.1 hypothetical protein EI97DRAFT_436534 [Westerdykella ornata]
MVQRAQIVLSRLESDRGRLEGGALGTMSKSSASSPPKAMRSSSTSTITRFPSATPSTQSAPVDSPLESSGSRRPSIISRLKSSISTFSTATGGPQRLAVSPEDFLSLPESPEKRFIDSVGMVIPGVCDRKQCSHPLAHFVINWRLCNPIEYTTALADHGITFSDYTLLLAALANFLEDMPPEPKPKKYKVESGEQFGKIKQQAAQLDRLLRDITHSWRTRGVPVMVCVRSFALFTPNRVSESHIQVLHVPFPHESSPRPSEERISSDPFEIPSLAQEQDQISVSTPHRKTGSQPQTPVPTGTALFHHHHVQLKDRTRPWPLWPNAIPTSKRGLIDAQADRYGLDPYFRGYMRANVDSRTNSVSYAKFMIERENNPFINSRLDYLAAPSPAKLLRSMLARPRCPRTIWHEQLNASHVNRERYEHNRRLECRRTVESGSRLRIVSFAFRHPLYPPHTPEMTALGLSKDAYENILSSIEEIRNHERVTTWKCMPHFMCSLSFRGRRSTEQALAKVREYIRTLNKPQGKVIWTIEEIPGVYDGLPFRSGKQWEISAWNNEDQLEQGVFDTRPRLVQY